MPLPPPSPSPLPPFPIKPLYYTFKRFKELLERKVEINGSIQMHVKVMARVKAEVDRHQVRKKEKKREETEIGKRNTL
jgi:hypothetical protein